MLSIRESQSLLDGLGIAVEAQTTHDGGARAPGSDAGWGKSPARRGNDYSDHGGDNDAADASIGARTAAALSDAGLVLREAVESLQKNRVGGKFTDSVSLSGMLDMADDGSGDAGDRIHDPSEDERADATPLPRKRRGSRMRRSSVGVSGQGGGQAAMDDSVRKAVVNDVRRGSTVRGGKEGERAGRRKSKVNLAVSVTQASMDDLGLDMGPIHGGSISPRSPGRSRSASRSVSQRRGGSPRRRQSIRGSERSRSVDPRKQGHDAGALFRSDEDMGRHGSALPQWASMGQDLSTAYYPAHRVSSASVISDASMSEHSTVHETDIRSPAFAGRDGVANALKAAEQYVSGLKSTWPSVATATAEAFPQGLATASEMPYGLFVRRKGPVRASQAMQKEFPHPGGAARSAVGPQQTFSDSMCASTLGGGGGDDGGAMGSHLGQSTRGSSYDVCAATPWEVACLLDVLRLAEGLVYTLPDRIMTRYSYVKSMLLQRIIDVRTMEVQQRLKKVSEVPKATRTATAIAGAPSVDGAGMTLDSVDAAERQLPAATTVSTEAESGEVVALRLEVVDHRAQVRTLTEQLASVEKELELQSRGLVEAVRALDTCRAERTAALNELTEERASNAQLNEALQVMVDASDGVAAERSSLQVSQDSLSKRMKMVDAKMTLMDNQLTPSLMQYSRVMRALVDANLIPPSAVERMSSHVKVILDRCDAAAEKLHGDDDTSGDKMGKRGPKRRGSKSGAAEVVLDDMDSLEHMLSRVSPAMLAAELDVVDRVDAHTHILQDALGSLFIGVSTVQERLDMAVLSDTENSEKYDVASRKAIELQRRIAELRAEHEANMESLHQRYTLDIEEARQDLWNMKTESMEHEQKAEKYRSELMVERDGTRKLVANAVAAHQSAATETLALVQKEFERTRNSFERRLDKTTARRQELRAKLREVLNALWVCHGQVSLGKQFARDCGALRSLYPLVVQAQNSVKTTVKELRDISAPSKEGLSHAVAAAASGKADAKGAESPRAQSKSVLTAALAKQQRLVTEREKSYDNGVPALMVGAVQFMCRRVSTLIQQNRSLSTAVSELRQNLQETKSRARSAAHRVRDLLAEVKGTVAKSQAVRADSAHVAERVGVSALAHVVEQEADAMEKLGLRKYPGSDPSRDGGVAAGWSRAGTGVAGSGVTSVAQDVRRATSASVSAGWSLDRVSRTQVDQLYDSLEKARAADDAAVAALHRFEMGGVPAFEQVAQHAQGEDVVASGQS